MDVLLAAGGPGDGILYLQVSGGVAPRDHLPPPGGSRPLAFMTLRRFERLALQRLQDRGCAVVTHPDIRWPHATYKTTQLLPVVLAKRKAQQARAHEVIFVDRDDQVLEGGSSNFFAVFGGRARTAPDSRNILPGITRELLLEGSRDRCAVSDIARADLADAEEAFITSTTRFVLPVIAIDGVPVGDGRPGPVTRELAARLDTVFEAEVGPPRRSPPANAESS
jgi:D-alanine transaminase